MGSSVLYSSTDANAPVMLDGVGALAAVLKKCLVTGYGTKPGLGWTQEYISPDFNTVVFRNKGTGMFLKVSNSINYASTGVNAMVEVFEAMSEWDTGYIRTPEEGVNHYIYYANTKANSRVITWKLIGDDKGFWFIAKFATTEYWAVHYLGDYISYELSSKYNWITCCPTAVNNSINHWSSNSYSTVNDYIRTVRKYNNQLPCSKVYFSRGDGMSVSTDLMGFYAYQSATSKISAACAIFAKPYFFQTLVATPSIYTIIGEVPGLNYPITYVPNNTITVQSADRKIHTFWCNTTASLKLSILEGEGFRP